MKKDEMTTIWDVWSNDLPAKFPKNEAVEMLSHRWNISKPNVYARLRSGRLKNFVHDISILYTLYAIGFTTGHGFFFDPKMYDAIQHKKEMEAAKMFGLSKSVA